MKKSAVGSSGVFSALMTYAFATRGRNFYVSCKPSPLECVVLAVDTLTYAIMILVGGCILIVGLSYLTTGT
jgi:hypothetical protein